MRNWMIWMGGGILCIFYAIAVFCKFIAPYSYRFERRDKAYHPPTGVHFFDEKGRFHIRPFVYGYNIILKEGVREYRIDHKQKYHIRFFVQGERYNLFGIIPSSIHLFGVDPPGVIYLLGSDWNGRDIFSRILYGSRISLSIGIIAVGVSILLGFLIGGISGYIGGGFDNISMRIVELFMCFPAFYLMLGLRAVFPITMSSQAVYVMIVLILSLLGWPGFARVIRGMVLSIREREYIASVKIAGGSWFRVIFLHIFPQTISYILVAATLRVPGYILGESALSLLGLGITEPYPSWGNMLRRCMSISQIHLHPWFLFPGLFIFIAVMGFYLLGDGLRDLLDPKKKYIR